MFKIKNILLPTDFSKTSLTAAEYAVELADEYKAKLHVLNVLEKTPPILAIRSLDLSREKIIESIDADAQSHLADSIKKIKKIKDVEIISAIRKGIDYEEIVKYSKQILMKTSGIKEFIAKNSNVIFDENLKKLNENIKNILSTTNN